MAVDGKPLVFGAMGQADLILLISSLVEFTRAVQPWRTEMSKRVESAGTECQQARDGPAGPM
jgi:hypothetical protein